jgi:hypothetical protein
MAGGKKTSFAEKADALKARQSKLDTVPPAPFPEDRTEELQSKIHRGRAKKATGATPQPPTKTTAGITPSPSGKTADTTTPPALAGHDHASSFGRQDE